MKRLTKRIVNATFLIMVDSPAVSAPALAAETPGSGMAAVPVSRSYDAPAPRGHRNRLTIGAYSQPENAQEKGPP